MSHLSASYPTNSAQLGALETRRSEMHLDPAWHVKGAVKHDQAETIDADK